MKCQCTKKNVVYTIALALTSVVLFLLFFHIFSGQIYDQNGLYDSDIHTHIKFSLNGSGYSLLYRIMGVLHRLAGSPFPIAVMEALMVVGTWLLSAKWLKDMYASHSYAFYAFVSLPTLGLTGMYLSSVYECFYKQQLVTQPYHNITYIGMRFFAVPVMILFYKVFEQYLESVRWKQWVCLAIMLVVSTAVKPSFFYGFALALLVMLIVDFIRTKCQLKPFTKMVIMGLVVIPSLCVMALQAVVLFDKPAGTPGGSGIALIWGARFVKKGFLKTTLKLICGLAFPCLVAFFNRDRLKKTEIFTYLMYVVQLLICILFSETGKRAYHGNFYWGLYGAAFFVFLITFARFADNVRHYRQYNKIYILFSGLLCATHLVSSASYFWAIFNGSHYYL